MHVSTYARSPALALRHGAINIAFGLALANAVSFVSLTLAFAQSDEHLGKSTLEIDLQWHDGHALDADGLDHLVNFRTVRQEFPCAGRNVIQHAGGSIRADIDAVHVQSRGGHLRTDIPLTNGNLAIANRLDFRTFENHAAFQRFLDGVIVSSLAVFDDRSVFEFF